MKKSILASALIAFASISLPSQANSLELSLCEAVASDNKKVFRSFLKKNKLKIRSIFSGVKCNGQDLLTFASTKNAVNTGSLMISKLPRKVVEDKLANLKSADLIAVANERVNS